MITVKDFVKQALSGSVVLDVEDVSDLYETLTSDVLVSDMVRTVLKDKKFKARLVDKTGPLNSTDSDMKDLNEFLICLELLCLNISEDPERTKLEAFSTINSLSFRQMCYLNVQRDLSLYRKEEVIEYKDYVVVMHF